MSISCQYDDCITHESCITCSSPFSSLLSPKKSDLFPDSFCNESFGKLYHLCTAEYVIFQYCCKCLLVYSGMLFRKIPGSLYKFKSDGKVRFLSFPFLFWIRKNWLGLNHILQLENSLKNWQNTKSIIEKPWTSWSLWTKSWWGVCEMHLLWARAGRIQGRYENFLVTF